MSQFSQLQRVVMRHPKSCQNNPVPVYHLDSYIWTCGSDKPLSQLINIRVSQNLHCAVKDCWNTVARSQILKRSNNRQSFALTVPTTPQDELTFLTRPGTNIVILSFYLKTRKFSSKTRKFLRFRGKNWVKRNAIFIASSFYT